MISHVSLYKSFAWKGWCWTYRHGHFLFIGNLLCLLSVLPLWYLVHLSTSTSAALLLVLKRLLKYIFSKQLLTANMSKYCTLFLLMVLFTALQAVYWLKLLYKAPLKLPPYIFFYLRTSASSNLRNIWWKILTYAPYNL